MSVKQFHRLAMGFADQALEAKKRGELVAAYAYFDQAFIHERQAALLIEGDDERGSMSRIILLKSAAYLAFHAQRTRDAEQIIGLLLAEDAPDDILDEMRDLLEEVNFNRHLELKGINLNPHDIQISLSGPAVSLGMIPKDEYLARVEALEKMAQRSSERIHNLPFRQFGPAPKAIQESVMPFLSTNRAASFAFTVRFGQTTNQQSLFENSAPQERVFNDLVENIYLLQSSNMLQLRTKMGSDDYYKNFLALSRQLAPDGKDIKQVGLTLNQDNEYRKISFTRPKSWFSKHLNAGENGALNFAKEVILEGELSYADKDGSSIKITDKAGKKHTVKVPDWMLADIVRPHFLQQVKADVLVPHGKKTMHLLDLKKID